MLVIDRSSSRRRGIGSLVRDRGGLALIEFAFTLPILLAIGLGALELANVALANLRVDHTTIDLADNAARMGQQSTSTGYQVLTESNVNDAIQAVRLEMPRLTANGRLTISSVEARADQNGNITQFLHWQRCAGTKSGTGYDSAYGPAPYDDSGMTIAGVGSPLLTAPSGSALIYVEVSYDQPSTFAAIPLFGTMLASTRHMHYVSAMIVRQNRSTNDSIDNTAQATKMTCNKYTA